MAIFMKLTVMLKYVFVNSELKISFSVFRSFQNMIAYVITYNLCIYNCLLLFYFGSYGHFVVFHFYVLCL